MKPKVVITGMGTVNPLSLNVHETWKMATSGRSGIDKITHFEPDEHTTRFAGEVKGFDPASLFGKKTARHMDRFVQFAVAATDEALQDAALDITDSNRDRIGVIIGSGIGGVSTLEKQTVTLRKSGPKRVSPFMVPMMLPDTAAGQVAINFGTRGPNLCITSACASSTNALGEAAEIIRRGSADIVISELVKKTFYKLLIKGRVEEAKTSLKAIPGVDQVILDSNHSNVSETLFEIHYSEDSDIR